MLGFILIGVGVFIIFDAADLGFWELIFAIPFIVFGIVGMLAG